MPSERPCDACGRPYTAKRPSSKFCSDTCRQRAQRGSPTKPATDSPVAPAELSALYVATMLEVEALNLVESRIGQQILALADKMTGAFDTGSAKAALSKELDRLMDKAIASVTKAGDSVDEMKARRDAKRNRAQTG